MAVVKDLLQQAAMEMADSDTPMLDVQLLLAEVLGVERVWLLTWNDAEVTAEQEGQFRTLIDRRVKGEPIAYILGRREFWGLEFECNQSTLIPRPDTERLVESALDLDLPEQARVLELGTGTGCIALSLASERPSWQILASDYSKDCTALAKKNADKLGINNVRVIQSDWYEAIETEPSFDLVLSNPPYIDPESPYLHEGDVRFEPDSALTSANTGLEALRAVINKAPEYLTLGGWLLVEHGYDQAASVRELLTDSGFSNLRQLRDLAGLDRCSGGQLT